MSGRAGRATGVVVLLAVALGVPDRPAGGRPPEVPKDVRGVIVTFDGKMVGGVEASTKAAGWRPAFEKDLAAVSAGLPGKPELKVTYWYAIINGCAVHWAGGDKATAAAVRAALGKRPGVLSVEFDEPARPDRPGGSGQTPPAGEK